MVGPHHFIPKPSVESLLFGQRLYFIGSAGFSLCLKIGIFSTMRTVEDIICNDGADALHDPVRSKLDDCFVEMEAVAASGQLGAGLASEDGDVRVVVVAGFDDVQNSVPGAMCAMASSIKWVIELLEWECAQSNEGDDRKVYKHGRIVDATMAEDVEEEEEWEMKRIQ